MKTLPCPSCNGTGRVKDPKAIGAAMRKLREKTGISLRAFARILKLSAPYVSDLELGQRGWSDDMQARYISALRPSATRRPKRAATKPTAGK